MRSSMFTASVLAIALPMQSLQAQAVDMIPIGGSTPKPVPMHPVDPKDSPEEIARDAAGDLKDSRFYNKPGATRADYERNWQECRLIARGSRTPAGTVPYAYNPAVVAPAAAAAGGFLGGLIAGAIIEGQQRRANRRNCLLIRGWRVVELPAVERKQLAQMDNIARSRFFDTIVGAQTVQGEITERRSFSLDPVALGNVDAPVIGAPALFLGKKVDISLPVALGPNEGAVVLAFRRNSESSRNRHAVLSLARYDRAARDLIYRPRNWKKTGDKTTYNADVVSGNRKAGYEVQVVKLTAGDYVIAGTGAGVPMITNTHCFGAPTFRVAAGQVSYLGDFIPVTGAMDSSGKKTFGMGYVSRIEEARRVLSGAQPNLAPAMVPADIRNQATYACSAVTMDRWDLPGLAALETQPSSAKPVAP